MKRIFSLLLALVMLFSLVGCQSSGMLSGAPTEATPQKDTSASQEEVTAATPYIEFVTFPTEATEPEETDPVDPRPRPTAPVETQPGDVQWPEDDRPRPTEPAETQPVETQPEETQPQGPWIDPNGSYTRRDDVALYLHLYGRLPNNFITKSQARALGWNGGSLERYAPGKCIGGDIFKNREGHLPSAPGRYYYECDIDTLGASSRGEKRIVFSNDGLVYYTSDHYRSFTLLYGAP